MAKIQSESQFLWKLILQIILTPFVFIQILFRKKRIKDLFLPFELFWDFLTEPKFTFYIIIITVITSLIGWIYLSKMLLICLLIIQVIC